MKTQSTPLEWEAAPKFQPKVPMKIFFLICTAFTLCVCGDVWQLPGQPTVSAAIQFSNGKTVTVTDFSEPIGVLPNAVIDVTVALSGAAANEQLSIASLDGGKVIKQSNIIGSDGTVSFRFKATRNVGENRVEVHHGLHKLRIQFWVLDTANPQNNPPVITPTTPEA